MKSFNLHIGLLCFLMILSCQKGVANKDIDRANITLQNIFRFYTVEKEGLFTETYPINPNQQVTYLADNKEQNKKQEVSYLWPYSGVLSGCVSLYQMTGDKKYKELLEHRIMLGLEQYWDNKRAPACYQSYPVFNGPSDRFYDDNDWVAISLIDLYSLTKDTIYLNKAIQLQKFIYSGWSDDLGGGIFWCEQKKHSKNTCSNAPAAVLCMKLFMATSRKKYLDLAKKTYQWTKDNLCDPTDYVYWDNKSLNGHIAKGKFTYNSGQMIQAGVLLYKATGEKQYLIDAQKTSEGTFNYFVKIQKTAHGEVQFYNDSPWFNVILFRGLKALFEVDHNKTYLKVMADDAEYAWRYDRDKNGLFSKDWTGEKQDKHKWLLDNACMIELYSELSNLN
jgi:uncharacterized protein YyaL (SSP411 family)